MPRSLIPALMILTLAFCSGTASTFKPALLYDQVGKSDSSLNETLINPGMRARVDRAKADGILYVKER